MALWVIWPTLPHHRQLGTIASNALSRIGSFNHRLRIDIRAFEASLVGLLQLLIVVLISTFAMLGRRSGWRKEVDCEIAKVFESCLVRLRQKRPCGGDIGNGRLWEVSPESCQQATAVALVVVHSPGVVDPSAILGFGAWLFDDLVAVAAGVLMFCDNAHYNDEKPVAETLVYCTEYAR